MKSFLKKLILSITAVSVFAISWGYFCDWFFANPKFFDDVTNKRAWTIKQRGQKFDFAVLGSSRAYGSFDMPQLSSLRNKTCINLGANGSGYVDNYLILYLFLKNQNKINTLYLQVDIYSLNSKNSFSNAFHTYQFLPFWQDSVIRDSVSPFIEKKELAVWALLPSIRYFKFNKYFSPKEVLRRFKLRKVHVSPFDKSFGGPASSGENEELQDNTTTTTNQKRTFDRSDIAYLMKIIALCKKNDITLTAYKAPELREHQKLIENYDELGSQIESMLESQGISYLKSDATIETNNKNFSNPTHLNSIGRELFTRFFSESIVDTAK